NLHGNYSVVVDHVLHLYYDPNHAYFSYVIFFSPLSRYVDHQDLHSFPTRRSSDLWGSCSWTQSIAASKHSRGMSCDRVHPCCRRSEEHTSELQSRENLVCRLLLEKKIKSREIYSLFFPRIDDNTKIGVYALMDVS